jgi:Tol biopolymer transport system component
METKMKRVLILLFIAAFTAAGVWAQTGLTFDAMINIRRVGDPQLSPDGRTVAYTVGVVNKADNRTLTHIYVVGVDGTNLKQITKGNASHSSPRWSPDGKLIAYVHGRADLDDGTRRRRCETDHSSRDGAGNPVWSPDGKWIAFSSEVYPNAPPTPATEMRTLRPKTAR